MTAPDDVRGAMLAAVPNLRAFAVSLCGDIDRANDLVQETLLRAWSHLESFEPGTNMSAWLFTILRNHFRTEYRKRRREVEDVDVVPNAGSIRCRIIGSENLALFCLA